MTITQGLAPEPTRYSVRFLKAPASSLHIGDFTGPQVVELCTIIYGDPLIRAAFELDEDKVAAIVVWYESNDSAIRLGGLRTRLKHWGRSRLEVLPV
jgi:hypothetical protein